jgi:hypothetical protein
MLAGPQHAAGFAFAIVFAGRILRKCLWAAARHAIIKTWIKDIESCLLQNKKKPLQPSPSFQADSTALSRFS